ncbi:HAD family phosphatase [Ruminococcaceae bacterium OttesenSCG-928-N02]|nr:HAD family phosphatase [Ruminococcaceae bacterium OttesenSCG-928-N02]
MQIKTAIFDMDGTLLDSMGMWRQVPVIYLEALGLEVPAGFVDEFMAVPGMPAALQLVIDRFGLPLTQKELEAAFYETVDLYYKNEATLKPGAMQLLEALKARGVKMALATASPIRAAMFGLECTGILPFFDGVFSGHELGTEKKEEPRLYDIALEHLGGEKATTAVFEDSFGAARTAKAAGYLLAAVADESEPKQEELKALADWYLQTPENWPILFE